MFARIARLLRHWIIPHHTNNFRAKLLHNSSFFALIGIFVAFNLVVRLLESTPLHILGFSSTVTIDEVVSLTNQERIANGLPALRYNATLADAARRKAANMLEENYWAHNSPSGKSPWVWLNAAGYKYSFAGENLGKDFGSTASLVSAWMASETHKKNIVNDKFEEIGVAVVPGTLIGQETVLVVQLFGSSSPAKREQVLAKSVEATPVATSIPVSVGENEPVDLAAIQGTTPVVLELKELSAPSPAAHRLSGGLSGFGLKKFTSLMTTILLILVFLVDIIVAESKNLSRRVGKNWAHLIFINVVLILVTIANAGSIL